MTAPVQDPFSDPIIPPSTRPTVASLRGRLIMITPRSQSTVPDTLNPGKMKERITADITVVDGAGPVPLMKGNPPRPTGQYLEGPDFTGMWLESTRIIEQLSAFVGTGKPVLGIIDTRNPGTDPIKGNPWGLTAATPEQKAHAVNFLNSRMVGGSAAPFQPQPAPAAAPHQHQTAPSLHQNVPTAQQYAQPPFAGQTAPQPQYAQPQYPQQVAPPAAAPAQVPAPLPQPAPPAAAPAPGPDANPFLQQAAAQPVNPFLQQAPAQPVNPFLQQQAPQQ